MENPREKEMRPLKYRGSIASAYFLAIRTVHSNQFLCRPSWYRCILASAIIIITGVTPEAKQRRNRRGWARYSLFPVELPSTVLLANSTNDKNSIPACLSRQNYQPRWQLQHSGREGIFNRASAKTCRPNLLVIPMWKSRWIDQGRRGKSIRW